MKFLLLLVVAQVFFSCSSQVWANPIDSAGSTNPAQPNDQTTLEKILENQSSILEKVNKIETRIAELKPKKVDDHHDDNEVHRSMTLDEDFSVAWETCGTTNSITFTITANTSGYIGFGISPTGLMDKADLVIGGMTPTGHYFGDYHGENHTLVRDTNQTWQFVSATETKTQTILVVTRPIDTHDPQDIPIGNETTKFIWAIGATDDIGQHLKSGSSSVNILAKNNSDPEDDHDDHEVHRKLVLDPEFEVEWETCGTTKTITFNITAKTLGYIQFGISPSGQLADADLVVRQVINGVDNFGDFHGTAEQQLVLDSSQDWKLESSTQTQTHTNLVVSRSLATNDVQDAPITNGPTHFMWAVGAADQVEKRGTAFVNVLERESHEEH